MKNVLCTPDTYVRIYMYIALLCFALLFLALQTEQTWTGIPVATTQGEQSYIKGNTKYMAVAVQVGFVFNVGATITRRRPDLRLGRQGGGEKSPLVTPITNIHVIRQLAD